MQSPGGVRGGTPASIWPCLNVGDVAPSLPTSGGTGSTRQTRSYVPQIQAAPRIVPLATVKKAGRGASRSFLGQISHNFDLDGEPSSHVAEKESGQGVN